MWDVLERNLPMNFVRPCRSKKYRIYQSEILRAVLEGRSDDPHHSELMNLWNGQMGSRQGMSRTAGEYLLV